MSINKMQHCKGVIADSHSRAKFFKRWAMNCAGAFFVINMVLPSGDALAIENLNFSDVSSGYSDCSYFDNDSSGRDAIYRLTIHYNAAESHLGGSYFWGRAVMLYTYDGNGVIQNRRVTTVVWFNGRGSGIPYQGSNYFWFTARGGAWSVATKYTAEVWFSVLKSDVADWPWIGVRAANATEGNDVAEVKGLAYIGPESNGNCTVITNPDNPPLPVTPKVTMTAPDWDLGELPRGKETVLEFPAIKDQLCFIHDGKPAITDQKYLINATNANGLSSDGRYLLRSLEDNSQTVPYTLALSNSNDSVLLPNTLNRVFSLRSEGGKTCFIPTFRAQPDKAVKGGAYSDILTFTVVAKP